MAFNELTGSDVHGVYRPDSKQVLTSGYGTGLTKKQQGASHWPLDPMVGSNETVEGGASAGAGTALSATKTIAFCDTATSKAHVKLVDGVVVGQIKIIIHKTYGNTTSLVITPDNFAWGTNVTSNHAGAVGVFVWDGSNWHVTENAGMIPA